MKWLAILASSTPQLPLAPEARSARQRRSHSSQDESILPAMAAFRSSRLGTWEEGLSFRALAAFE
jgi:hypothetical protein